MRGGFKRPVIIGLIGLVLVGVALTLNFVINSPEFARKAPPPKALPETSQEQPALEAPAVTPPGAETVPPASKPSPGAEKSEEAAKAGKTGAGPSGAGNGAAMPVPPSFDVVRIGPNGEAVVAGRASPHAEVTILNGGKEIGHVTADANGEWVWLPDKPFEPGNLELSLSAKLPGQEPVQAESKVVLIIPKRNKTIAGAKSTEGSSQALVLKVPNKAGPTQIVQAPTAPGLADVQLRDLMLDTIDYDEKGNLILGGRAKPGTGLRLYLDNGLLGETMADDKGRWILRPKKQVAPGKYTLRVDEIDKDDKVIARIELPFSRAEPVEAAATAGNAQVVVQPGNSLWRIARRSYGSGLEFTVIYQANKDQIRDPDLIYPGQVFKLPNTN